MTVRRVLALCASLVACGAAWGHQAQTTIPEPGFRPAAPAESQFIAELGAAQITVLPTLVRRIERTAHSITSQEQAVRFLNQRGPARVEPASRRIDRGRLDPDSQWNIFQASLAAIGESLARAEIDADYVMALEILVPGDQNVFGIECYILTRTGENAFSFLLNEHHEAFARAGLVADDSQASRDAMIARATDLALQSLEQQIARARCAATEPAPVRPASDVIDDFQAPLPAGSDANDIPLGFSTFDDGRSQVRFGLTTEHPPVPREAPGNAVLAVELEVESWAGVLHRFSDPADAEWRAFDWTGAVELSFWFHGNDSGTALVFDVLDNRRPCSARDDAERYTFEFRDAFSGWRLISIPFEVMTRKEIWNGAPADGLGLTAVHGWALAALHTEGELVFYVDDVRLRRTPLMDDVPPGLSRETGIWVPVNELPMFGEYPWTDWQERANEQFIETALRDFRGDRSAAAEYFARTAWNHYYRGENPIAIKRFNQAWLLDAGNQKALWGFAVISRERGQTEKALRFYRLALEAGPAEPTLQQEYESLRREARE